MSSGPRAAIQTFGSRLVLSDFLWTALACSRLNDRSGARLEHHLGDGRRAFKCICVSHADAFEFAAWDRVPLLGFEQHSLLQICYLAATRRRLRLYGGKSPCFGTSCDNLTG